MTDERLDELERTALEVKQFRDDWGPLLSPVREEQQARRDYIQAVSPDTILQLVRAAREAEKLREALGWYADRRNYSLNGRPGNQQMRDSGKSVFWRADMGDRARAALGGDK